MNKLTINEKKIIAEKVHGWTVTNDYINKGHKGLPLYDFNPDQDLTQFVAMIGALDDVTNIKISMEFKNPNGMRVTLLDNFNWLCSHKYEVCKAVIEVIK